MKSLFEPPTRGAGGRRLPLEIADRRMTESPGTRTTLDSGNHFIERFD